MKQALYSKRIGYRLLLSILVFCAAPLLVQGEEAAKDSKTVLLAILARNKAHVLPKFLDTIDKMEYDKKLITVYINTNNNVDDTKKILEDWSSKNRYAYRSIIFESRDVSDEMTTDPHVWNPGRFKVLANIRNRSLQMTKEHGCDFYFVVDCDNFLTPKTLRTLVSKDKPIVAPMIMSIPQKNDMYTNFFYKVDNTGFFANDPQFYEIFYRRNLGTHKVDLVHCVYLIKSDNIDKLNYIDDSDTYEFIIFARSARKNGVDQYICNEIDFGVQLHPVDGTTLEQEVKLMAELYPEFVR